MKDIRDNSISLIFADPPYNLIGLDNYMDLTTYRKWCGKWFNECKRVLNYNGTMILCGRPPVLNYLCVDLLENEFISREWVTWHKVDSITPSKEKMSNNYECFAVFSKWSDRVFNHLPIKSKTNNYSKERNIGCIWEHCKISSNHKEGTTHPTQKPLSFLERFIETFTNENDTILDPFAGSGTTAIACLNTNRNYICIEMKPEYYNMIQERIHDHSINQKLEVFNQ